MRLGRQLPRPRRRAVRRPARPLRHDAGRVQSARHAGRRSSNESKTLRAEYVIQVTGQRRRAAGRHGEPEAWRPARSSCASPTSSCSTRASRRPCRRTPMRQDLPNEELRLEHRYLDLRRPEMQQTLLLRDRMIRRACATISATHGLHRRGDADPRPQHAGRGPRLPGAEPRAATARSTPCRSRRSSTSRF